MIAVFASVGMGRGHQTKSVQYTVFSTLQQCPPQPNSSLRAGLQNGISRLWSSCNPAHPSVGTPNTSDTSSSVSLPALVDPISLNSSTETATGHTQWEHPIAQQQPPEPSTSPPVTTAAQSHHKRRQYAAGQTQAYYGAAEVAPDPGYVAPGLQPQPAGGQLFTPGLAAENQFQSQQTQAPGQPHPYFTQPLEQPTYLEPYDHQQQQQRSNYVQPGVDALAGQFGQMGMGGQKQFQLYTTNLLTSPPDPHELFKPPPEIRLPPNACISPSPYANAEPSYQRCTINAIPTTSSLLNKAKIPLALVLTPYRSLKDGDDAVPVVTDTVIARCRRCRTYINPYVQFIDGGNRCDPSSNSLISSAYSSKGGAAACVICRTKSLSCSTGIKQPINLVIGGNAQNLTIPLWSLLLPPSTWSAHHNPPFMSF